MFAGRHTDQATRVGLPPPLKKWPAPEHRLGSVGVATSERSDCTVRASSHK